MRAVLYLLLMVGSAGAESRHHRAAHHFAAADRAFRAGQYAQALARLEAGYALDPRPEFLIPLAQTYRELGRLDEALDRCEKYLALAPPGRVANQVAALARELRQEHARTTPPPPAPEPEPPEVATPEEPEPPPAAAPPPPPIVQLPAPPPAKKSHRSAIVLGVVGASVAVAVGLGVGLGVGLASAPASDLGTIRFR
jgi:tetratricopeptide (TPR) repeat protein